MNGEMERIWLATANGELRFKVLALKQALACWDVVFEMIPKRDSDLGRLKHDIVADEIVRLRAERDTERALADQLADALKDAWSLDASALDRIAARNNAVRSLFAHQEARRG